MNNLCTFSNLKQNLHYTQFESSLVESIQTLETTKQTNQPTKQSEYRWYYRDNDDELEMYGFDETNELENNWQNYISGQADPIQPATTGYFANCFDKHCIDFSKFTQYNVDSKESRQIIRAVSNHELNTNFLQINSTKLNKMNKKSSVRNTCVNLQTDLLKQQANGGDAVTINIASYTNNIIHDTLFAQYKNNDIPIATYIINKTDHKNVDNLLNCFINYQQDMDIIKLYPQCDENEKKKIKVNSTMISYLISQQKCNFILYDTDFELLAVGKYNASYIYNNDNNNNINPYRYQSFIEFHNLLTLFCEMSLKNDVEITSIISCFNKNIRSFLMYDCDKKCALWTPTIDDKQLLKQILSTNIMFINFNENNNEYESDEEHGYDSANESCIESTEIETESMYDTDHLECSVCYENISLTNELECDTCVVNHKDLCHSCLVQWKESGHDTCPKCGVAHVNVNINVMHRQ